MQHTETDRAPGRIDWPEWAGRTPAAERETSSGFRVTLHRAISDIRKEMEDRLGVDGWRLSTAAPQRKDDGEPYADAKPDDPGAVLRWTRDGNQRAVPCDYYASLRDNVREIGLYVEEKRKMANRHIVTAQDEFATAALPGAEGAESASVTDVSFQSDEAAAEVLGVSPSLSDSVIEAAAKDRIKEAHPDGGGSAEELARVRAARGRLVGGES